MMKPVKFFYLKSRTQCDRKAVFMAITHIFKDGTIATELKDVYVPKEIVEKVDEIAKSKSIDTEGERKHEK